MVFPGPGRPTIATALARRTATPYLRVDRIEQTIVAWSELRHPLGPVGYAVAHQLAREQLVSGLNVIVECVNPISLTREAWPGTADSADADLIEVEVICSDREEHRRRVESRETDVAGLLKPTWSAVTEHHYEPWTRRHVVVDSATTAPGIAAARIAALMTSGMT